MSNNGTIDFGGVSNDPETRHLALADVTNTKVTQVIEMVSRIEEKVDQLTDKVDQLTNKVDQLTEQLDGLGRQIARLPSGITLNNAVGQILDTVNEIRQKV